MRRWMAAGLCVCFGCATTTGLHRPPTAAEVDEINQAASTTDHLEVEYDPPAAPPDPASPVGMKTDVEEGRLVAADLHHLTFAPANGPPLVVPATHFRAVSVMSHRQGMAGGLIAGVAAALLGGIILGSRRSASTNPDCEFDCTQGSNIFLMTVAVGLFTLPIGTGIGAAAGQRRTFSFGVPPPAPAPPPSSNSWGL